MIVRSIYILGYAKSDGTWFDVRGIRSTVILYDAYSDRRLARRLGIHSMESRRYTFMVHALSMMLARIDDRPGGSVSIAMVIVPWLAGARKF
jgi:hypothetical protein